MEGEFHSFFPQLFPTAPPPCTPSSTEDYSAVTLFPTAAPTARLSVVAPLPVQVGTIGRRHWLRFGQRMDAAGDGGCRVGGSSSALHSCPTASAPTATPQPVPFGIQVAFAPCLQQLWITQPTACGMASSARSCWIFSMVHTWCRSSMWYSITTIRQHGRPSDALQCQHVAALPSCRCHASCCGLLS